MSIATQAFSVKWYDEETEPDAEQAAPPPKTPFDTCPTCEALARWGGSGAAQC